MANSFGTFGGLLSQAKMRTAVDGCLRGDLAAWAYIRPRDLSALTASERTQAAGAFYLRSKEQTGAISRAA
jgi:hypothetical protein